MINGLTHLTVLARDLDEARDFYVDTLGFTVAEDMVLEQYDNRRWLTVSPPGQPELKILFANDRKQGVFDQTATDEPTVGIFGTDDIRALYEDLKDRGVVFRQVPVEHFYGTDATFLDPTGNQWRVTQPVPQTAPS